MKINFFVERCQSKTLSPLFGLCDDPPPSNTPAYIDTEIANQETKWIAVVKNDDEIELTFTAIDHCIDIKRENGEMDHRCDGILTSQKEIIFVELKERDCKNRVWIEKAQTQLKISINYFKVSQNLDIFKSKKAYIANRKKPNFQSGQMERMNRFKNETGVRLIIQNTIEISSDLV